MAREGRHMAAPMGEEGLRVAEAREAVRILSTRTIGEKRGVLVLGPMDLANEKACDVLLKSIEEIDPEGTLPILWATDLSEVRHTIANRCICVWKGGGRTVLDKDMEVRAAQLVDAVLDDDLNLITRLVGETKDLKALGEGIAREVSERAQKGGNSGVLVVWQQLRSEMAFTNPSKIGVSHALLSACGVLRGS